MSERKNRIVRFHYFDETFDDRNCGDIYALLYNVTEEELDKLTDSTQSYIDSQWSCNDCNQEYGDFMQLVIDVLKNCGHLYEFMDVYNIII